MTTHHTTSSGEPLETISVDQMESYIASERAERWTQSLGDVTPVAALMDGKWEQHEDADGHRVWVLRSGTWYVVWEDAEPKDVYELAPPSLAAALTDFLARLRTANDEVERTDARHGAPRVEGETGLPAPRSPEP